MLATSMGRAEYFRCGGEWSPYLFTLFLAGAWEYAMDVEFVLVMIISNNMYKDYIWE